MFLCFTIKVHHGRRVANLWQGCRSVGWKKVAVVTVFDTEQSGCVGACHSYSTSSPTKVDALIVVSTIVTCSARCALAHVLSHNDLDVFTMAVDS